MIYCTYMHACMMDPHHICFAQIDVAMNPHITIREAHKIAGDIFVLYVHITAIHSFDSYFSLLFVNY